MRLYTRGDARAKFRHAVWDDRAMSGADWTEAFLEMMATERAAAANTLIAYGRDLADAEMFLKLRGRDLATAGPDLVEAYFADLGVRGLSAATASRRRAAVRQFYRFVLGEGWRNEDPSRRVEAPRKGRPLPKVLTREEVNRLIAAATARDGAGGARLGARAPAGRAGLPSRTPHRGSDPEDPTSPRGVARGPHAGPHPDRAARTAQPGRRSPDRAARADRRPPGPPDLRSIRSIRVVRNIRVLRPSRSSGCPGPPAVPVLRPERASDNSPVG